MTLRQHLKTAAIATAAAAALLTATAENALADQVFLPPGSQTVVGVTA